MKELSIEQKAKAYDNIIEKANKMHCENCEACQMCIEELIPELRESEDERIRKQIRAFIKSRGSQITQSKTDAWLSWLEKQGEQKPADNVETKFHEGDIIIHKELGGDYIHNPHKIIQVDILDKKYRLECGLVAHFGEQDDYELIEQKPAWSKEDEEQLNFCCAAIELSNYSSDEYRNYAISFLESLKDRVHPLLKQEWKQENIDDLTDFEIVMMHIGDSFFGENAGLDPNDTNAIKEQANILLGLVPKQEWSEEDEDMCYKAIAVINRLCAEGKDYVWSIKTLKKLFYWLKSLRPQSQWKPSELQIEALESATENCAYSEYQDCLRELIGQLKKL